MRNAIDDHATGTTNAFSAIVIKCDGIIAIKNDLFIQQVKHLQKGGIRADIIQLIVYKLACCICIGLAPYL